MTVSIVILNWNGEKFLQQFLPVLIQNTQMKGAEIVVADNASTDNSLAMLSEKFPAVRTIVLDQNHGFAEGYNRALVDLETDYYVLLNSDVEVTPHWLEPLIAYMEHNTHVAACQPKIRAYDRRTHFEHAGAAGGFIDRFGFPFCRGRILGTVEKDECQYNTVMEVFWASGACMVVREKAFWTVAGFDGRFFAHMEEIDLCWRMKSVGYRIVCIPESTVYHVGGGTLNVESPFKTYLNFRNNLLMLYKNLPDYQLKKVMMWRVFFDYVAAVQLFITGKPRNALSVLRARRDFKKMLPRFVEARDENMLNATHDITADILKKSIVIEYYLKGKKSFNELVRHSK